MKFLLSLVLFSFVSVIAASAFATALPQGDTSNDFRWQGRIGEGKTVEIKGVNGEVRAEVISGEEVEVVAVKRSGWGQGNPQEVQIKLIEHAGGESEARRQLRLNTVNGSISFKGGRGTSAS